jgi:hypothetical protein
MPREKDTRKILSGVQVPDGSDMRTFYRDEDMDDLEEILTQAQVDYLKEQKAIEGEWSPKGDKAKTLKQAKMRPAPTTRQLSGADQDDEPDDGQGGAGRAAKRQAEKTAREEAKAKHAGHGSTHEGGHK